MHDRMTPSEQAQVPVEASRERTASPSSAPIRSSLATAIRQYPVLLRVLLAEYRTSWSFHIFAGLLVPLCFAFFIVAVGGVTSTDSAVVDRDLDGVAFEEACHRHLLA